MIKYGIAISDLHCGHLVGLTPADYQLRFPNPTITKRAKWYKIGRDLWDYFEKEIKALPKLDFIVVNGDSIEGKGKKSGGTELLTSDMQEQCNMAVEVIEFLREQSKPKVKIIMTYGTDYHTMTGGDDWENIIAKNSGADKIGSHEWIDVNGCVIDAKHHIGGSSIPHGRYTAIAKEELWNLLWADIKMQPRADIVLRSHVHYFASVMSATQTGIVTPALQGMGSKYGSRQCSGHVDWGFIFFAIKSKTDFNWKPQIHTIKTQAARVYKV